MKAEDQVMVALEQEIEGVLDTAYRRMGCEPPRRNGKPMLQMVHDEIREMDGDELVIWMEAWRSMFALFFDGGPHPAQVLKNIYALAWCVAREHVANMTQTQLGELFGETRAAWCERIKIVYVDFLKKRGFRGTRVPGQKTEGATKVYAGVQKDNKNRASGRRKGEAPKPPKQRSKRRP